MALSILLPSCSSPYATSCLLLALALAIAPLVINLSAATCQQIY